MKFKFTLIVFSLLISHLSYCQIQKGLEGIIVEKYYISDSKDAANTDGGTLPVGSTTYRVYVDMKPGFRLISIFGDVNHELSISSTTKFFNNEDRGDIFPKFNKNVVRKNTVMLDSWITIGNACADYRGVLKSKDDGIGTVINSDGILANNDSGAGIPLTEQDGMIEADEYSPQAAGFGSSLSIFDNTNDFPNGSAFKSNDGAWFTTTGAVGVDPTDNMVLVGQFTTNGILKFNLNVQLGTPAIGGTQIFVASNPLIDEYFEPTLNFDSSKTATNDINNYYTFNSYPNPTTGDIYFSVKDLVKETPYTIIDMDGRLVQKGYIDPSSQKLSINELKNGVYVLQLLVGGKKAFNKIVKI